MHRMGRLWRFLRFGEGFNAKPPSRHVAKAHCVMPRPGIPSNLVYQFVFSRVCLPGLSHCSQLILTRLRVSAAWRFDSPIA